jgi:hypothetical protein
MGIDVRWSGAGSEEVGLDRNGKVIGRIDPEFAIGPLPRNAPASPSLGVFALRVSKIFGWCLRGLGRPTPFFDDFTRAPLSTPHVLTRSERAAL